MPLYKQQAHSEQSIYHSTHTSHGMAQPTGQEEFQGLL
jgi:hypothetical protein